MITRDDAFEPKLGRIGTATEICAAAICATGSRALPAPAAADAGLRDRIASSKAVT
jgi:hypothetical protein